MEMKLVVLEGKHRGQKIKLPLTQFVIGRDDSCHLRPVSTDVSKFHCAIANLGDRFLLRDLGSTNGTFLNGRRISRTTRIKDGDIIQVGPLRFQLQSEQELVRPTGDSSPEWLLRIPDEQEHRVLDPAIDTMILEGPLNPVSAANHLKTKTESDQATVVAGRFLREYVAQRKGKSQSDKPVGQGS